MLLTGDPVNAQHAKEIGLINDHFEEAVLEEEVLRLAENIASKSKKVVKIGKKAFYNNWRCHWTKLTNIQAEL